MYFLTPKFVIFHVWRKQIDFKLSQWQNSLYQINFPTEGTGSVVVDRNTETGESSFRGKNILKDDGEQPVQAMLYGQRFFRRKKEKVS